MASSVREIPLEKTIVARIVTALKAAGAGWVIKTHGGAFQCAGLPDILCVAPKSGRLVGIEVKRPKIGRLTDLQKAQLAKINLAGGVAGVAYGAEDALALLNTGNQIADGLSEEE